MSLYVSINNFKHIQQANVSMLLLLNENMYLSAGVHIQVHFIFFFNNCPIFTEMLPKLLILPKLFTAQSAWINASNSPFHFTVDSEEI